MANDPYTIILHGNDATGKSTLAPVLRAAGEVVYTRGDEDKTLEDVLSVRGFDKYTLQLADDDRSPLPQSYTDKDGVRRRIVRIILDAKVPVLQARLVKRPSTDEWESEKSLFYFRARFLELASFHGLPVVDTGKKGIRETVCEIMTLARDTEVLGLFSKLALRTLTPEAVALLASRHAVVPGIDYARRLRDIIATECGETSIFTAEDIHAQCASDPRLLYALVNQYDDLHDTHAPLRLRLIAEGESKQIYKAETSLTNYFDDHILVLLKPTIYSHSKQSTAEIEGLSAIRAAGSRLFLEMLHRAGIDHTYQGLNSHGLIWASRTEITAIETVYKGLCAGTDKHSFFGMVNEPNITLPSGQYKRGPYVRFDWRNPNHVYKGANPTTHPFYHLMEASIGKNVFYEKYLTARAEPFGDKCVSEELVHSVQAVQPSLDMALRIFFTIQHYLNRIGLEVQDGCVMLDPTGRTMWSEINQDCMRIKRRVVPNCNRREAFDKDVWRAGGSSVQDTILDKWTQLNNLLRVYLTDRPFHQNEMVTPYEPYGLHARQVLADAALRLTPHYRALYQRLASHDRSHLHAMYSDKNTSERLLALMQEHMWQLIPDVSHDEAGKMVRLVNTYARGVGLAPEQVSTLSDQEANHAFGRPMTPPGAKAIGVTACKYADKTDDFLLDLLGIKLIRPEGRCLRLNYEIVDASKLVNVFGEGVSVHFVPTRPKDIPGLLAQGRLDAAVTYSSVMDNFPAVARLVACTPDADISIALIGRRGQEIDPATWTADRPARIVAEHVRMIRSYLASMNIPSDTYDIQRVLGSSESYLVNDPRETYLLCDAIICSGSTLEANDLKVWKVVKDKGDIVVGLYSRL